MNVRDWLAHREPSPPRELLERVEVLAAAVPEEPGGPAGSLLAAAEKALARLRTLAPDDRSTALDLLAIDALVTYALEWTADDPQGIPEVSARAMTILSRVSAVSR